LEFLFGRLIIKFFRNFTLTILKMQKKLEENKITFKSKVIIAIGAHPDDIELGCGGTIHEAVKDGTRVVAVTMTKGEQSGDGCQRCGEARAALAKLGVTEVHFGDFPDTEIPASHEAVRFLETFVNKENPETILTHSVNSMHQDHRQVGWLTVAAFRTAPRILAYETPRVTSEFTPVYYIDISDSIKEKCDALKMHNSQNGKKYINFDAIIAMASFRGQQVNVKYAEAFEVVRFVEQRVKI
jgi:LmbE family N-acetylglucosaminyl deacetylase